MTSSTRPFPAITSHPRHLPHFRSGYSFQHITYRLADSIPRAVILRFEVECKHLKEGSHEGVEYQRKLDQWLDTGYGSCILQHPEIATCIIDTWKYYSGDQYDLHAFVVMPNHCHVLIETRENVPLWRIVLSWKSFTARMINKWKRRTGQTVTPAVWQRDYWDRLIRNPEHFSRTVEYIEQNPVKAGLVLRAEEWEWGSAAWRRKETGAAKSGG